MVNNNRMDSSEHFLMEVVKQQADRVRWLERLQSYVRHREHCEPSDDGSTCSCGLLRLLNDE